MTAPAASQNLPAIGKAADGFVTGVGYATSIDSPENRKFVADFEAANKAAPDLYGADSYGVLFFYKAAVEKAGSSSATQKGEQYKNTVRREAVVYCSPM